VRIPKGRRMNVLPAKNSAYIAMIEVNVILPALSG
jgi:hypothetical protein